MPTDTLTYYKDILDSHPRFSKVGAAIRWDDIPGDAFLSETSRKGRASYYKSSLGPGIYMAPIDTTFYLSKTIYKNQTSGAPALRVGSPYWCGHLPYYIKKDLSNMSDEYLNYIKTCHLSSNMKGSLYYHGLLKAEDTMKNIRVTG